MALGAKGVISVLANVAPRIAHEIAAKYLAGDAQGSRELQIQYLDLCNDLFIDVNPIPAKETLVMMGWEVGECRMPLAPLSDAARAQLRATLVKHGLVK